MSRSLAERASFRDPAGQVFERDGVLLRRIAPAFVPVFREVCSTGLISSLQESGLLVPHEERGSTADGALLLQPERLPFISYPYEWVPSQLRDAALVTLDLAEQALSRGQVLRDASAFNIQFRRGRPILIDTLSFAPRAAGEPWRAYGQFCRHFLAPLALASLVHPELLRLPATYPDGIPLRVASRLLHRRGLFRPGILVHLHLQAMADARAESRPGHPARANVSPRQLAQTIDGLRSTIEFLPRSDRSTAWTEYQGGAHYGDEARREKAGFVTSAVAGIQPKSLWDLGANTGALALEHAPPDGYALALDADLGCVERAYAESRRVGRPVVCLWSDLLASPAGGGWAGEERASLADRGPAELVLALALVHHLALGGRVPFQRIATWLASVARHAVVELPGKEDPMVKQLVECRGATLDRYGREEFVRAVTPQFEILQEQALTGIDRTMYLLRRRA